LYRARVRAQVAVEKPAVVQQNARWSTH